MAILANKDTKVIVQGITGGEGGFHSRLMMEYGTQLVGGVVPGKGGQWFDEKVPIFDTVEAAVEATGATATMIMVSAPFAPDAIVEAADNGIKLIVCITEHIPVRDMMKAVTACRLRASRSSAPRNDPQTPNAQPIFAQSGKLPNQAICSGVKPPTSFIYQSLFILAKV